MAKDGLGKLAGLMGGGGEPGNLAGAPSQGAPSQLTPEQEEAQTIAEIQGVLNYVQSRVGSDIFAAQELVLATMQELCIQVKELTEGDDGR